jgi:hypothetical protein
MSMPLVNRLVLLANNKAVNSISDLMRKLGEGRELCCTIEGDVFSAVTMPQSTEFFEAKGADFPIPFLWPVEAEPIASASNDLDHCDDTVPNKCVMG